MQIKAPPKALIPNYLTILRLILIVPFFALFVTMFDVSFTMWQTLLSVNLVIFVIALTTDYWDGYLARKWKVVSEFGKIFDPIADKIIINSSLIFLSALPGQFIPVWVVVLLVLRDIVVDGVRNLLAKNNVDISASIWGKLKTVFQTLGIIIVMLVLVIVNFNLTRINIYLMNIPLFVALGFSYVSAYFYIKPAKKLIQGKTTQSS